RNRADCLTLEGNHGAKIPLGDRAHCGRPESERQVAVVGDGRTTPLDVSEDQRAGLLARALLDLTRETLRDSTVAARLIRITRRLPRREGALGHHDDAEAAANPIALPHLLHHPLRLVR